MLQKIKDFYHRYEKYFIVDLIMYLVIIAGVVIGMLLVL